MIINRVWAMPSKWTFTIKPIAELLARYVGDGRGWIDPFAGESGLAEITNDLNPNKVATCHMDALEFLHRLPDSTYKGVLFDPPYSPRQVSECYQSIGIKVTTQDTQSRFWGDLKKEIARTIVNNGICITFGWNSNGIGKKLGFEIVEILLVPHGGWHNDTIVTVERKLQSAMLLNGVDKG